MERLAATASCQALPRLSSREKNNQERSVAATPPSTSAGPALMSALCAQLQWLLTIVLSWWHLFPSSLPFFHRNCCCVRQLPFSFSQAASRSESLSCTIYAPPLHYMIQWPLHQVPHRDLCGNQVQQWMVSEWGGRGDRGRGG